MFSTWARRCDKVVFVTEEEDEELPVMKVNVTGRENLGGRPRHPWRGLTGITGLMWTGC